MFEIVFRQIVNDIKNFKIYNVKYLNVDDVHEDEHRNCHIPHIYRSGSSGLETRRPSLLLFLGF